MQILMSGSSFPVWATLAHEGCRNIQQSPCIQPTTTQSEARAGRCCAQGTARLALHLLGPKSGLVSGAWCCGGVILRGKSATPVGTLGS